jgi:hypothetical protein
MIGKLRVYGCGLLLLALSIATSSAGAADAKWQRVSSPEGRFSVEMPVQPTQEAKKSGSPVGTIHRTVYVAKAGDTTYEVQYMDLPGLASMFTSAKTITDRMKKEYTKTGKGTVVSDSEVQISGKKGRQLVIQLTEGGTARAQSLKVGNRLYIVSHTKATQENGDKFFSSFQLAQQ